MTRIMYAMGLFFSISLIAGCDAVPFMVSAEESAIRACEERLKGTLKSPASYRRLWSSFIPAGPVNEAEYLEKLEADRLRAIQEGNDAEAFSSAFITQCLKNPKRKDCEGITAIHEQLPRPDTAHVLIEYEAVNSFNVKLPGYFTCRMNVADDGSYDEAHIFTATTVPHNLGKQLKSQSELFNR